MSTTVRITKVDKEKLDQLNRYLSFKARRKITQEELMASLIAAGEKMKDGLSKELSQLEEEEASIDESDSFFHMPSFHLGRESSKEHDRLIYGSSKGTSNSSGGGGPDA